MGIGGFLNLPPSEAKPGNPSEQVEMMVTILGGHLSSAVDMKVTFDGGLQR
jgi:hypothetical protein